MFLKIKSLLDAYIAWMRKLVSSTQTKRYGRKGIHWDDVLGLILIAIVVLAFICLFVGALAFMLLWPLALAWAINYLFGTAIPITFTTWLAIFIVFWAFKLFTSAKITIERRG